MKKGKKYSCQGPNSVGQILLKQVFVMSFYIAKWKNDFSSLNCLYAFFPPTVSTLCMGNFLGG